MSAERETVAFLGPEASFSAEAAQQVTSTAHRRPLGTISEVFQAVRAAEVDVGVVPIENLIEGAVNETLDQLAFGPGGLVIAGELLLPVRLQLLAAGGVELADVQVVRSHVQALAQARGWLAEHLPGVGVVAATSTAEAARMVTEPADQPEAAVATLLAAERFGLRVLASDVQAHADNVTRFVELRRVRAAPTGADKTSLMLFFGEDRPGLLLRILEEFAIRGINLVKIESRPAKTRMGEYGMFIDADGHLAEPRLAEALRSVHRHVAELRVLGSYPRADGQRIEVAPTDDDQAYAAADGWYQRLLDPHVPGPAS